MHISNCGDEGSPAHFSSVNMYFIYDILQNSNTGLKEYSSKVLGILKISSFCLKNTVPGVQIIVPRCPKKTIVYAKKNNSWCPKKVM